MGLQFDTHQPLRSRLEPPEPLDAEAAGALGVLSVYCRQCVAWVGLSTSRRLSTHRTSGGVITYFRCEAGHTDFYSDCVTRFGTQGGR